MCGGAGHALADLSEAIRLDPADPTAFMDRASVHYGRFDFAQAVRDATTAIRLAPVAGDAYLARGEALVAGGDMGRGMADFAEAIRLRPDQAAAYLRRGLAYRRIGQPDKAVADLDTALSLERRNFQCLEVRAAVRIARGTTTAVPLISRRDRGWAGRPRGDLRAVAEGSAWAC